MKKLLFALFLLMATVFAFAVDDFTVTAINKADYGNHDRIYLTCQFPSWYPYWNQCVVRVFFVKDHMIGDEYPQFDYLLLYRPMPGFSWQRTFWVVAPAKLENEWHLRLDVEDNDGVVLATSHEFTYDFGSDIVVPSGYSATLPWVAADVFDWNTSVVVTNPTAATVDVDFAVYSMTGSQVKTWGVSILPRSTVSFYLSNFPDLAGYCGWMTIESDAKLPYEQMTVYYGTPSFAVSNVGILE